MPATIDGKGIASGWTVGEDGWGPLADQNFRQLSAMILAGFAQDVTTTTGLTYGYKGGTALNAGGLVVVPAGTITVPASATSFIVRSVDGTVSVDADGVFPDKIHLATVTTNVSSITSVVDARYTQDVTQDGTHFARYFSGVVTPATAGFVRMGNTEAVVSRNAANTANIVMIFVDSSNKLRLADTGITTQLAGPLEVLGSAALVDVAGRTLVLENPGAADDTAYPIFRADVSSGGVLGELYYRLLLTPSLTADNRIALVEVADNTGYRSLGCRVRRVYFGPNAPSWLGAEIMRVDGAVRATDFVCVGGQFTGSGAGLTTDTVPFLSVVGLNTIIGALQAADGVLDGRLDTLEPQVADILDGRPFTSAVTDNVPVARVDFGADLGYGAKSPSDLNGGRGAPTANSVGNTNSELYAMCCSLNDIVGNLINDLNARGVI